MAADALADCGASVHHYRLTTHPIGLLVTLQQAVGVRQAANQARDAARKTAGRMLEMRLHVQVGHLERLGEMLDAAITTNNHQLARAAISLWDSAAANVIRLEAADLRHLMRESRVQGRAAAMELDDVGRHVSVATATLRPRMREAMSRTIEVASSRFSTERLPQVGGAG